MEYEQEENQEGGVMDRLRESPRTVTALIIILIVAAAIYAFGGDEAEQDIADISDEAATTTETEDSNADAAGDAEEDTDGEEAEMADGEDDSGATVVDSEQPAPEAVSPEELASQEEALPEATQTEEGYVEVAEQGDGLTHLARRAATRYLNDQSAGYEITNEHRIYIEDYIKDRMERTPLHVGSTQTISFSLLEEAVAAAGELNESQLNNLSQYTYALN